MEKKPMSKLSKILGQEGLTRKASKGGSAKVSLQYDVESELQLLARTINSDVKSKVDPDAFANLEVNVGLGSTSVMVSGDFGYHEDRAVAHEKETLWQEVAALHVKKMARHRGLKVEQHDNVFYLS